MPRGVPKSGFRIRNSLNRANVPFGAFSNLDEEIEITETDEEINARIQERFDVLHDLTVATVNGESRSLIVSGPPGLGKSYTVEQVVSGLGHDQYCIERGFVRATGLYRMLHKFSEPGKVIILDDADSVFNDDVALSLLKVACDTTDTRSISWRAETKMQDDDGITLPTNFEFHGSVIFITNQDMDRIVETKQKFHEHMAAMISRSHYIDLTMKSKRDFFIRVKQVVFNEGMLNNLLTFDKIHAVIKFMEDNLNNLREISLRMALKITSNMRAHPDKWERVCRITCCK